MAAATHEIPRPKGLTERQVRGFSCVWCGASLDDATAVDLPPQPYQILDHRTRWYPRACLTCAGGAAS
jgi:hypothetical protein